MTTTDPLAEYQAASNELHALDVAAESKWRKGYDSADPSAIPLDVVRGAVVMGYPDFGWPPAAFARYRAAGATTVRITQHDPPDWQNCSVIDFETGAVFDGPSLRRFVVDRNEHFSANLATVYSDVANLPAVRRALAGLDYCVWVAAWPAYPTLAEVASLKAQLGPGARLCAIQYRNLPALDYDLSVVLDPSWHRNAP
jgi:hypothetical protein